MKKILVTGSNGYIGNALVLALLNRKKEFTVRAAARRGSILNSKSFETVRLGSLEESPDLTGGNAPAEIPTRHIFLSQPKLLEAISFPRTMNSLQFIRMTIMN